MAGGFQSGPGYGGPPRRSGSGGCLVWGLVGCGVLVLVTAIVVTVVGYRFAKSPEFQKMVSNFQSSQSCSHNLVDIRDGLDKYLAAHKGKYPANLSDLVPKYLPDKSDLTCGGTGAASGETPPPLEYTPPKPDAPGDTPVVSYYSGENAILTQKQLIYLRLLKDGRIVQDTVTRIELRLRGQSSGSGGSQ